MYSNKIKNEKGDLSIDTEEIQRNITSYWNSLSATKLENVKKNGHFLDKYHIPKLNKSQVNNLNRHISPEEIDTVIKNFPTKKQQQQQ